MNINVPKTQPDRGNQWQDLLNDPECDPVYIYLSLGSNDCDSFGQRLSWLRQQQLLASKHLDVYGTEMIYFDPLKYYEQELDKFIRQIDLVIGRLESQFKNAEIVFSCIFERVYRDELTLTELT